MMAKMFYCNLCVYGREREREREYLSFILFLSGFQFMEKIIEKKMLIAKWESRILENHDPLE